MRRFRLVIGFLLQIKSREQLKSLGFLVLSKLFLIDRFSSNTSATRESSETSSGSLYRRQKTARGEPRLSIVIPNFNQKDFLALNLKELSNLPNSVKNELELVLVDDGSLENPFSSLWPYLKNFPNFVFLRTRNRGLPSARNAGISLSAAKYLLFLDADDSLNLGTLINVLQSVSNLDEGFAPALVFDWEFELHGVFLASRKFQRSVRFEQLSRKEVAKKWGKRFIFPIGSVVVPKRHAPLFDERLISGGEDLDFWKKLAGANIATQSFGDSLYVYRIHPEQMTFRRL